MRRILSLITILLMFAFVMTSCQKNTEPLASEQSDDVTVQELAMSDEDDYLFDIGIDDGSEDAIKNGEFGGGFGKISTPIDSVWRFGRHITRRGLRRLEIVRTAPDTFKVAMARELGGQFVIVEKFPGDSLSGDTLVLYRKPLQHVIRRKAIYVKRQPTDLPGRRRGWQLYAVSMGQGNSVPNHTIDITEIMVTTSGGDTLVFTDPLNTLMNVEDIPRFVQDEIVTVRVKLNNLTGNPIDPEGNGSTETVLLHYGVNRRHHVRKPFDFVGIDPVTGEHIYEGSWTIGQEPFHVYHAVVDVIDNGTIYDSDNGVYPYNSTTWSTPYFVTETE